jgi:hypothetical protein
VAVLLSDIRVYAATVAPEDDTTTQVGGAPDLTKKHDFTNPAGPYQVVSSSAADTTQTVTVTHRVLRSIVADTPVALNGQTPVAGAANLIRVLKAVKSATCAGDIAVEAQTAEHSGTAQGAGSGTDTIQLDTAASTVDDAYNGRVIRLTAGPGVGELAVILDYVGATQTATVSKAWATPPTSATSYRLAPGLVFDRQPSEIMTVARVFISAESGAAAARTFYQKVYVKHTAASGDSSTLTTCTVIEADDEAEDVGADIRFGLDAAINTNSDNGVGNNRQVAPAGVTFGEAETAVPGNELAGGSYIGVWLALTLPAGQPASAGSYIPRFSAEV